MVVRALGFPEKGGVKTPAWSRGGKLRPQRTLVILADSEYSAEKGDTVLDLRSCFFSCFAALVLECRCGASPKQPSSSSTTVAKAMNYTGVTTPIRCPKMIALRASVLILEEFHSA